MSLPIFDGHNDTLLRLQMAPDRRVAERQFLEGGLSGHMDLPRCRKGGFVGGLFAVYVGSEDGARPVSRADGGYDRPLPPPVPMLQAQKDALGQVASFGRLIEQSGGAFRGCRSVAEIRAAVAEGALAAVLHVEGAEAIDPELDLLHVLHAAGLRTLGPVWSRPNIFGHGVPMAFPQSPDTGPGLTEAGIRLVQECDQLGIMIDLSHLNEQGFWDVARISRRPLVASHSNVHALCAHSRNLTQRQLAAIAGTGGFVGLNFAVGFLRPDGLRDPAMPVELMVRHIDALVEALGIDGVGLGSDFNGTVVPTAMRDVAGLPVLVQALRDAGYDDASLRKICMENWLRVLELSWA